MNFEDIESIADDAAYAPIDNPPAIEADRVCVVCKRPRSAHSLTYYDLFDIGRTGIWACPFLRK